MLSVEQRMPRRNDLPAVDRGILTTSNVVQSRILQDLRPLKDAFRSGTAELWTVITTCRAIIPVGLPELRPRAGRLLMMPPLLCYGNDAGPLSRSGNRKSTIRLS